LIFTYKARENLNKCRSLQQAIESPPVEYLIEGRSVVWFDRTKGSDCGWCDPVKSPHEFSVYGLENLFCISA